MSSRSGKIVAGLLLGVLALAIPAPTLAAVPSHAGANAIVVASVYIHYKPKLVTGVQGGSVNLTTIVKNNGTASFVAKSCKLLYRPGTSGIWTKAGSCLSSAAWPYTFTANSTSTFSATQPLSKTLPTGSYQWKIRLVGTYGGSAAVSHFGYLTVIVV